METELNTINNINDAQKIIERELSKPEYQQIYNKVENLYSEYKKIISGPIPREMVICHELIQGLKELREYENRMLYINFNVIY